MVQSRYLQVVKPAGALYGFIGVKPGVLPSFDDTTSAMRLLENKHALPSFFADTYLHPHEVSYGCAVDSSRRLASRR